MGIGPKFPETLEESHDEIQRLTDLVVDLEGENTDLQDDLSSTRSELDAAENELEELRDVADVREAAEAVIAETDRPVGAIHDIVLRDTPAARRALRALSDAAGRQI